MADGREPRLHLAQRAGRSPLLPLKRRHVFFQPRTTASRRPQRDAFTDADRAVAAAMGPLYAALSDEQERTADELLAERLRDMRKRGP